jgi:hypothetical protein
MQISGKYRSHNCKLFGDSDGENSFLEIKYIGFNEETIIFKKCNDTPVLQNK